MASRSIVCRSRRKKQIIAACKINFFQYYKIISAIPNQLLLKAGQLDSVDKQFFTSHYTVLITILESTWKKRNHETFTNCSLANSHWVQTGPKRWSDNLYLTHSLPEQFTKNGIFMTFWTFSARAWVKLAPICSKRHLQAFFPLAPRFTILLLKHAQKSKFRDFRVRKLLTSSALRLFRLSFLSFSYLFMAVINLPLGLLPVEIRTCLSLQWADHFDLRISVIENIFSSCRTWI